MAHGLKDWYLAASASFIVHGATHISGGADELSIEGLLGSPAELTEHVELTPASVTKPHDIREVDVTSVSVAKNKVVSNLLAKGWEDHKDDATIHIPTGLIAVWSGTLATIPDGWALCDGGGGRPNLFDKFLVCVPNGTTNPGDTGGAATHTHGAGTYLGPEHNHTGATGANCCRQAWDYTYGTGVTNYIPCNHTHTISNDGTGAVTGTSAAGSSLPPYYEVAFIYKT